MATVYTVGHSNTPVEILIDALLAAEVKLLVDIRRYPSSRRNPRFNHDRLAASLAEAGIGYEHFEALGGRRDPAKDSPNQALTNDGFRGYADYLATPQFEAAQQALVEQASAQPTAVMCAEALPWSCHRSILADALVARGHEVIHLYGGQQHAHKPTPVARIEDGRVTYPALL